MQEREDMRSYMQETGGGDTSTPPVVPVPAGTPAGTTPQHARKFKIAGGGRGELRRRLTARRAVKRLKPRQMETPWLTCEWAQGIEDEACITSQIPTQRVYVFYPEGLRRCSSHSNGCVCVRGGEAPSPFPNGYQQSEARPVSYWRSVCSKLVDR